MGKKSSKKNMQPAIDATALAEGMDDQEQGKRTAKATVFTHLFGEPEYRLQLVQELHPEMKNLTLGDITLLTLTNVLLDTLYNDLGLLVRNKLLIFLEAQATWSVNIIPRLIMYLGETYKRLIKEKKWNVYGTKALPLPEPEFYVIYTGSRKARPKEIKFSTAFFGGKKTAVEITVKVIYGDEKGDIISQYVTFCHVLNEQYRKFGYTAEAVREAIRICKDKDVLKKYLEEREGEVIDMMITLFDQETIRENYVAARVREATAKAEKAAKKAAKEAAAKADKAARADERQKTTLTVNLEAIKNLMETTKWSPTDAMNAMKIPPDQQAIYLKKL